MKKSNNKAILTTKCIKKRSASEMETTQHITDKLNNEIRNVVEYAITMGNALKKAKVLLPDRDEWIKWLRNKVEISEDQAENYMNVARIYPDPKSLSASEMSKAFELITYTC